MKLAILFSGQGAQYPGMGSDFIERVPELKAKVKNYRDALHLDIESLLQDEVKVNDTLYTQPLMVVVEMLIHDYILSQFHLKVDGYTGFSLGEFTAFYAAGIFQELDLLKVIQKRAKLMQEASNQFPGKMAAILGLDDETVASLCQANSTDEKYVVPANYNSPGQLVISGESELVEKVALLAKENGAKRAIVLNVSGAFHSPYMRQAGQALRDFAADFTYHEPKVPLYANATAKTLSKEGVLDEIETQMQSPVYFKQTIEQMIQDGFTHFLEIGPGSVLSGLVRKMSKEVVALNVSKFDDLEKLKEILT